MSHSTGQNEKTEQQVNILLVDKYDEPVGNLIISAIAKVPIQNEKELPENGYKRIKQLKKVPETEDPDSHTPIQYCSKSDLGEGARIMLLEEERYEILFQPDHRISNNTSIKLFPTIKEDLDHNNYLYNESRLAQENRGSKHGVLNFRSYVGKSFFDVKIGDIESKRQPFEVRSRKINYQNQYPVMISELSSFASGILLEHGAPLYREYDFGDDLRQSPEEAFMFLEYVFRSENLPTAMNYIRRNMHNQLRTETNKVPFSLVSNFSPETAINFVTSESNMTRLQKSPDWWPKEMRRYIPKEVCQESYVEDIDIPENRVVKDFLLSLDALLNQLKRSDLVRAERSKGKTYIDAKVGEYIQIIQEYLSDDWIMDVGNLEFIPSNSQVLQKRSGYRKIFELFLNFEFAFRLRTGSWTEVDDLIKGYQKKLSELYEYWCYIKLLKVLAKVTNEPISYYDIFEQGDGWTIRIKKGRDTIKYFNYRLNNIDIQIGLMYNKLFSRKTIDKSYSLPFRPDYTMVIEKEKEIKFVHFDAKYRSQGKVMEYYDNIAVEKRISDSEREVKSDEEMDPEGMKKAEKAKEEEENLRKYKNGDVYKMHTYKDAILSTEGAYILYPGDKNVIFKENEDYVIPSVGAFPLSPDENSFEERNLERFVKEVIKKVSTSAN